MSKKLGTKNKKDLLKTVDFFGDDVKLVKRKSYQCNKFSICKDGTCLHAYPHSLKSLCKEKCEIVKSAKCVPVKYKKQIRNMKKSILTDSSGGLKEISTPPLRLFKLDF